MQISQKTWNRYKNRLAAVDKKAAEEMEAYLQRIGGYENHVEEVIRYAYALASRYGEAAAAAACQMHEAVAEASGVRIPPAVPAEPPDYKEVARAVRGTVKNSSEKQIPRTVGRLVKRTGADTTLKNAERDGAQFAWIPMGDTCAFCLTLASRGWQHMSKNALKNGHAEHIHANCDCQYAIRFDDKTNIAGYDPDKYLEMYENAEGDTPKEKINSMRRELNKKQLDNSNNGDKIGDKKSNFVPAKTIEEAETFISKYVDDKQFGALGVSYKGIGVDVANEINKTLNSFYETYETDKFGGIIAPAKNTVLGKRISNAHAGYMRVGKTFLLNRDSMKSVSHIEQLLADEKKLTTDYLNNPSSFDKKRFSQRLLDALNNSKTSGRLSVPDTIEDVFNHELGHWLTEQISKTHNYNLIVANMPKYAPHVSGYACDSVNEYIAESFCSYRKGESVADPELIKVFEALKKKR